jgi:hypothetical protein
LIFLIDTQVDTGEGIFCDLRFLYKIRKFVNGFHV